MAREIADLSFRIQPQRYDTFLIYYFNDFFQKQQIYKNLKLSHFNDIMCLQSLFKKITTFVYRINKEITVFTFKHDLS